MSDDNVKPIPVKFKKPPDNDDPPMLTVVSRWGGAQDCDHRSYYAEGRMIPITYAIREGETEIECGHCHTRLDPMFVLRRLAGEETSWKRHRQVYIDEMKRLNERRRTKCYHCGKMTEISR